MTSNYSNCPADSMYCPPRSLLSANNPLNLLRKTSATSMTTMLLRVLKKGEEGIIRVLWKRLVILVALSAPSAMAYEMDCVQ